MNIVSSAFGHYEVTGDPASADVLIGHSFGTLTDEGSANGSIANFILQNAGDRPIVADRMLVNAFPDLDAAIDHVAEGPISNGVGQGVGSWGTLVEAKDFMKREGLTTALMVGQAHHIGRVVMQAKKLGIDSIVPAGLPDQFDPDSDQRWTRSLGMWVPREVIGSFVLRAQKKL
jgi:hypothetical protein